MSSYYDDTVTEVFITFDRAIDASGYSAGAFVLIDGDINSQSYVGNAYYTVMPDGVTLRIQLDVPGPASGPDVELSVSSGNGIVGGEWASVAVFVNAEHLR